LNQATKAAPAAALCLAARGSGNEPAPAHCFI